MKQINLTVNKRSIVKKNASFKMRQKECVPGIIYGPQKENITVTLPGKPILAIINDKSNVNCIINITFEDDPAIKKMVMLKEYQTDPVKNRLLHVDLYEISMDREMNVTIPIKITGKPKGAILGGILEQSLREVEIKCLPGSIPELVEADVTELDLGDSLHLSSVKFPEGVKVVTDLKRTVAVVTVPKEEEAAKPAEGAAEGAAAEGAAADGKAPAADGKAPAAAGKAPAAADAKAPAGGDKAKAAGKAGDTKQPAKK